MVNIVSSNQNNNILVKSIYKNISGILYDLYNTYNTLLLKLVSGSNIKNYIDNMIGFNSDYNYYYSLSRSTLYITTNNITQSNMNLNNTANKSLDSKILNSGIITSSGDSGIVLNSLGVIISKELLYDVQTIVNQNKCYRSLYTLDINYKDFNISLNPTFNSNVYTYITTVGLYDLNNNLLAVGRLNKPVKNTKSYQNVIKVALLI